MNTTNVHEKMTNVQGQVASAVETAREAAHTVTSKVTDFFQGNPFDTPIGRKIELATDATKLATENWGLNMEICDFINNSTEGGRDAIRAIRKRLHTQMGKNNAIVAYTLTLLETCVKNCDQRFKALVCQKDFINELVKLVGAKFDAPQLLQEHVLGLIQSWADAFRGHSALEGVVEVYDELKSKGVEFPAIDLDSMAPIITPRRTVFSKAETTSDNAQKQTGENYPIVELTNEPVSASLEQLAKLRSELDIANVNLTVLRELLKVLKPNCELSEDFELLQQLFVACQEMQRRVVQLIPIITNEEVTYELLTVNDEFNAVFEKYQRYMMNRSNQSGPSSAPTSSINTAGASDLIDFSDHGASIKELENLSVNEKDAAQSLANSEHNNAYIHDQTEAGLRTAAFNKTKPISEREASEVSGWQDTSAGDSKSSNKLMIADDGL